MADSSSMRKSREILDGKGGSMELDPVNEIVLDASSFNGSAANEPETVIPYRLYKRRFMGLVGLVRTSVQFIMIFLIVSISFSWISSRLWHGLGSVLYLIIVSRRENLGKLSSFNSTCFFFHSSGEGVWIYTRWSELSWQHCVARLHACCPHGSHCGVEVRDPEMCELPEHSRRNNRLKVGLRVRSELYASCCPLGSDFLALRSRSRKQNHTRFWS